MLHPKTDLGGHIVARAAGYNSVGGAAALITAGGAGDNVEFTGPAIDLLGFSSGALVTSAFANLGAAETASLLVRYEQSADNSAWDAIATLQANAVQSTGPGGGGSVASVQKIELNCANLKRYVRFSYTWNFSAAAADDVVFGSTLVLAGDDVVDATYQGN